MLGPQVRLSSTTYYIITLIRRKLDAAWWESTQGSDNMNRFAGLELFDQISFPAT